MKTKTYIVYGWFNSDDHDTNKLYNARVEVAADNQSEAEKIGDKLIKEKYGECDVIVAEFKDVIANTIQIPEINPPVLPQSAALKYIKTLPDCPASLLYIVIGPFCYGKDANAFKAVKLARSNGGKGTYTIHRVNKDAEISGVDGGLSYNSITKGVYVNIAKFEIKGY